MKKKKRERINYKELYDEEYAERYILQKKVTSKNYLIIELIFLVLAVALILPNLGKNIDEGKFCQEKLEEWFPEYDWTSAVYLGGYSVCRGSYIDGENVKRDGLEDLSNQEIKEREFKLTSEEDIKYLAKDDNPNLLIGAGIFLLVIMFAIGIGWKDEI